MNVLNLSNLFACKVHLAFRITNKHGYARAHAHAHSVSKATQLLNCAQWVTSMSEKNVWLCWLRLTLQIKLPWELTQCDSYLSVWNRQQCFPHLTNNRLRCVSTWWCWKRVEEHVKWVNYDQFFSLKRMRNIYFFFFFSCSRLQVNEEQNTTEHTIHKPVVSCKPNWQEGFCLLACREQVNIVLASLSYEIYLSLLYLNATCK